jgi:D-methionine transport system permease protein
MNWAQLGPQIWKASLDTLYMVGVSTFFTLLLGLPLGILLIITDRDGLVPVRWLNLILGFIVNLGRSLPFVILLIAILPFTRFLVGTTIGSKAAIVPLAISAIPFFARISETSLREVDKGLIEAAQAMGCTIWQIIVKVLLPESLPSLVLGTAITIISLIGYSAMAGTIGGGGLGDLAIRYGYQRFQTEVMVITVILLIVMVQVVQWLGNLLARSLSHR